MSGSLSSFLSGNPVPPQPTGSDTQTSFPLWLQQYDYNLANTATNLANQPYTPYPGQQVATPSAATQQSWNMATGNVNNYAPALNSAMDLTGAAATPISANDIQQYMNPYTTNVVGALQAAANNNFINNQMPAISSQFVGSGQAASPQMMQADNNALFQANTALNPAVSQALQSGYQGALGTALQEQQMKQTAGAQYGQLGALQQQLGQAQTGEVAAAGQAQDQNNQANINASLNNFNAQQQWPYQNLAFASNITRGMNVPSNTQTVGMGYNPGASYTSSPLASFAGGALGTQALLNNGTNTGTGITSSLYRAKGGPIRGMARRAA